MRLFYLEMKKIFSWKILLLLAFVNVVLYFLLFEFEIEYFPNGRPAGDYFKIEQQMIEKYGVDLNEAEYQDFVAEYESEVKKAEEYLQNDPQAAAAGLTSYEAFRNLDSNDSEYEAKRNYTDLVIFERGEDLFWELQAREGIIDYYTYRIDSLKGDINRETGEKKERFEQLLKDEKYGVFSNTVIDNFTNIKGSIAIIVLSSIVVLTSPIFLRDHIASVVPLQYVSKKGRTVYRTKWLAGLVSTALVSIVLLTFYLVLYSTNEISPYFEVPLYAFVADIYWYDLTFFQYICLSAAAIFVCSMLLGILSMAVSTVVQNTIVLVGVQIVLMSAMIALVTTYLIVDMISIWNWKMLMPTGYLLLTISTAWFMFYVWRREYQRDVL